MLPLVRWETAFRPDPTRKALFLQMVLGLVPDFSSGDTSVSMLSAFIHIGSFPVSHTVFEEYIYVQLYFPFS